MPKVYAQRIGPLLAALLGGCTIGQPVQLPAEGGIFVRDALPTAAAASAAEARAAQYARCEPSNRYAGGLGDAICDIDARRLELLALAASASNLNASYNAWLWPLGSAVVYRKLRGASNRSLLPLAALGTGVHGYVNSGIPDRAKRYLEGAGNLACLIVERAADLYTQSELQLPVDEGMPFTPEASPGFEAALRSLRDEARQYSRARTTLLAGLTLAPQPGRPGSTFVTEALARHRGSAGGGVAVKDPRAEIRRQTQARLDLALMELDEGRAMHARIQSAGWRLRAAASDADRRLQFSLSEQVRAPDSPASAAAQILAQVKLLIGQSGRTEQPAEAAPDTSDAALAALNFDGLSTDSRRELARFQAKHGEALYAALRDVREWLKKGEERRSLARETATEIGCTPAASPTPPPPAPAGSARPATSVGGAAPTSGTALPPAR